MIFELTVMNKNTVYVPLVVDDVIWTTERQGAPGKLDFKIFRDDVLRMEEGNPISVKVKGEPLFFGFLWSEKRDKEEISTLVAYDQLRYFRYKDTYLYKNKTASQLLYMLATDRNLKTSMIEDTEYIIQQRICENKTFFDIIQDALELTFDNTRKLYVLYDDYGRITLRNLESMRLNLIVGKETVEDMDYQSTLDDVYNQIKLSHSNEKTGKREIYLTKDSEKINRWGLLQYYEEINEKTNGQVKAEALLSIYNRLNRSLTIKNAVGDTRARAGASVMVYLPDMGVQHYMLIDKAVHRFKDNEHLMDLTLRGRLS